ncbi:MAG TPA: histidine kinase [Sphingobacterium sp.]|nr:histidine kinase [Sphingobacterium sp.]
MPYTLKKYRILRWLIALGVLLQLMVFIMYIAAPDFAGWSDFVTLSLVSMLLYLTSRYIIAPWVYRGEKLRLVKLLPAFGVQILMILGLLIVLSLAVGGGEWDVDGDWDISNIVPVLFLFIVPNLCGLVFFVFASGRQHWLQLIRSEEQLKDKEKEFRFLQARIARTDFFPHFLKNTLSTIRYLSQIDPHRAMNATDLIISIFKYYNRHLDARSTILREELTQVEKIIQIYSIRLDQQLYLTITVHDTILYDLPIPFMMLSNLIENCCQHGLLTDPYKPAKMCLSSTLDGYLCLVLTNIRSEKPLDSALQTGRGLQHIEALLKSFDKTGEMTVVQDERVFTVRLRWKKEKE